MRSERAEQEVRICVRCSVSRFTSHTLLRETDNLLIRGIVTYEKNTCMLHTHTHSLGFWAMRWVADLILPLLPVYFFLLTLSVTQCDSACVWSFVFSNEAGVRQKY